MRVAIDRNSDGVIDNIIEADSLAAAAALFPSDTVMDAVAAGVQIGWRKDGDTYIAPPEPAPNYKTLTPANFIRHLKTHGGVTSTEVVAARSDANLAEFWIMLDLSRDGVERDDEDTVAGLAGLVALGYLTDAERQNVLDEWPT